MADEPHVNGSWLGDTVEEFKKLPTWGKILVGGIIVSVVGFAIYTYQKNKTVASANAAATQAAASQATTLPATSNPPSDSLFNPTSTSTSTSTSTTPTIANLFGLIRNRDTSKIPYDAANAQGIPIRDKPGGKIIGYQSFGSDPQLLGQAVNGPNNFGGNNPDGSNIWYQLANGGYVSGYDITNINAQNTPTVQPGSAGTGQGSTGYTPSPLGRMRQYTVQYGDNMNNVARQLGLGSWKDFGVSSFKHGQVLSIPIPGRE